MIDILKKHLEKLGFKVIEQSDSYLEMETEGNFLHNVRLTQSRIRWYLYYEIYKLHEDTLRRTLLFTQTEVFSTENELKDIIKDIDKIYEGRE